MQTSMKQEQKLSDKAQSNLSELDLTLVTASQWFKPEPEKTYIIRINPEDKVNMVKNQKFADKDGYVPTRFEFKILHPDNNVDQTFTVSKTLFSFSLLCNQYDVNSNYRHQPKCHYNGKDY